MSAALQKMKILAHFVSIGISTAAVLPCTLFPSCIPVTKPANLPVKLDGKSEWEAKSSPHCLGLLFQPHLFNDLAHHTDKATAVLVKYRAREGRSKTAGTLPCKARAPLTYYCSQTSSRSLRLQLQDFVSSICFKSQANIPNGRV